MVESYVDWYGKGGQRGAIWSEEMEVVSDYKYLGVYLANKLDWKTNSSVI